METTAPTIPRDIDRRKVADLSLEDLALENQLQRERITSLEADVTVYRELMQVGLHELAAAKLEIKRRREQNVRLVEELRRVREQRLAEAA